MSRKPSRGGISRAIEARLPQLSAPAFGKLGPAWGYGLGCGAGFGIGMMGGIGLAWGPPGLHLGVGFGAGCGIGIGYGYGTGRGRAYMSAPASTSTLALPRPSGGVAVTNLLAHHPSLFAAPQGSAGRRTKAVSPLTSTPVGRMFHDVVLDLASVFSWFGARLGR